MKKAVLRCISLLMAGVVLLQQAMPAEALQLGSEVVYGTSLSQIIQFDKYELFDGNFNPCTYIPEDVDNITVSTLDKWGRKSSTQSYPSYLKCKLEFTDDFLDSDFMQCTGCARIGLGDYELEVSRGNVTDTRKFTVWVSDQAFWANTGEVLPIQGNDIIHRAKRLKNDNTRSKDISFVYDVWNEFRDHQFKLVASDDSYNPDTSDGADCEVSHMFEWTGSDKWYFHREHSYGEVDRCYRKNNPMLDLKPWNKIMDGVEVGMDIYIPFWVIEGVKFSLNNLGLVETDGFVKDADGGSAIEFSGTSPLITSFNIKRVNGSVSDSVDITRYTDGDIRINSEGRFTVTAKTRGTYRETVTMVIDTTKPVFEGAISDEPSDWKVTVYDFNLKSVKLDGIDISDDIKSNRCTIERYYLSLGNHEIVAKDGAGHTSKYKFSVWEEHGYVASDDDIKNEDNKESRKVTKIVNLVAKSINQPNKMHFTWKRQGYADGYQVRYSRKADMSGSTTKTVKDNSIKISGVVANKLYYVKVRAYQKNDDGKIVYGSSWADAPVAIYVPVANKVTKVGNVKVQPGGKSKAIKVTWNKVKTATRYTLEYWQYGQKSQTLRSVTVNGTNKTLIVNGGKKYQARVRAEKHTRVKVNSSIVPSDAVKVAGGYADVVTYGDWSSIATGKSKK